MSSPSSRAARTVLVVGVGLYLALVATVLIRLGDVVLDLRGGAWVAFDDAGNGLTEPMVGALWDQWLWLWMAVWLWWPIAMGVLAASMQDLVPDTGLRVGHAVLRCLLPGLTSILSVEVFHRLEPTLASPLRQDELPRRITRIATVLPWSAVFSPALVVVGLVSVGSSPSPTAGAKIAMASSLLLPLAVPVALRAWQLLLLLQALAAIDARRAVEGVRAQHQTPVAG
jgi:hypothetical protein